MLKQEMSLRAILDIFADLYAPQNTIENDEEEVDNFVRQPKETIKRAMQRLSCLVDKLRCLSSPAAWPETKYRICKSVLKQIITTKTRQFIEFEESKIKKVGGSFSIQDLVEQVHEFEVHHGEVPKESTATVYQAASGSPADWANDLPARQKAIRQGKNIHEHTKHLANIIGQATTQVAASFVKGQQPTRSKSKSESVLHKVKKPQRSASASSHQSDTQFGLEQDDSEMTELDTTVEQKAPKVNNNYRADKTERGRSENRRSYTPSKDQGRSYSKENQGRSYSNGRSQQGQGQQRSYSKGGSQRSYSKDKNGDRPKSATRNPTEARTTITEGEDGRIVVNNQFYYTCTCASLHMFGQICPTKSGMPVHVKN
jgi:hypothetical protein